MTTEHTPESWDSLRCTCGNGAVQVHEDHCSVTIIHNLEQQRDALAEALHLVVKWYEDAGNEDPDQTSIGSAELYGKAKVALAKLS